MRRHLLASLLIRAFAPLVPAHVRVDWRAEWDAELASLDDLPPSRRRMLRRAIGALADAFWLRQRHAADLDWIDDLRYGGRQLFQHAGFALTAIGILAVGLTVTVAMFSITTQVLLRPLPYPDPDRIVTVWETRAPDETPLDVAPGNFLDWQARTRSFDHLAGVDPWSLDVTTDSRPDVWPAAKVTPGFFETFGVAPVVGRFFEPGEYTKGHDQVAVITESLWRQRFAADPDVVGTSMRTSDGPLTIVGVVPATFEPRLLGTGTGQRRVWLPKAIEAYEPSSRGRGYWAVVGRLKAGVVPEAAQADLTAVARQLGTEYPRTNGGTGVRVLALRDHLVGDVRLGLTLLAAAVALVLIIACVNLANLLLARGSAREREVAIRLALGARRGRIVRQLLLESLLLAVAGGAAGCVAATWVLTAIARLGPSSVPWIESLHLDGQAVLFGIGVSIGVAVCSGVVPAWRVASTGLAAAGRQTSTADATTHRLRTGLVVAQLTLALVLISGAGLLMRSFVGLLAVDPGFARDRVAVTQVFAWDYNPSPAQLAGFFDRTLERLSALPAVQAVGAVSAMPFIESNINVQGVLTFPGRPAATDGEAARAYLSVATPGYFEAMRIPLQAGRHLDSRDGSSTKRVAVITETLARRYWAGSDDALGDTVRLRFSGTPTEVEIVGIVSSLRHDGLDSGPRDELFMPLAQMPFGSMTFVVLSAGNASALLGPVRDAIWTINPAQSIYRSATLEELVGNTVSPRRSALGIIVGFALVSLLLAVGGVYGVLSAVMTSRLREVGLRIALGATGWDIAGWVVGRGLLMCGLGSALGLAGAFGAGQLLRRSLFQTAPTDPVALVGAATVMMLAGLAACVGPARRAAAADPITILRAE
ncbi:MAG: ABC transporter permease [Acidobacteriota bacterium]